MKKLIFTAAIIFSCLSIQIAHAQVRVSLGLNIGSQPDWGPVGYEHASYYYIPDIDAYYDVVNHQYVYNENNTWVHNTYLPARYHYDKYSSYKVVVNEANPWERHDVYRTKYAAYRGRHDQAVIRDSHDARYREHYREAAVRNQEVSARNHEVAERNRQVEYHNARVAHRNVVTGRKIRQEEHKERRD